MSNKICSRCNENMDIECFPIKNKRFGQRLSKCRDCKREYDREYWQKTKLRRTKIKNENRSNCIRRNYTFVLDYLKKNPCVHCGETDPIVLTFDHINPEEKTECISQMACWAMSIVNIEKEITKCRILCANCHFRHTAKQRNYMTYRILNEEQ